MNNICLFKNGTYNEENIDKFNLPINGKLHPIFVQQNKDINKGTPHQKQFFDPS